MRLASQIVLVTGASFGIGEATARRLAGAGATVLLVARSADRLAALVAELRAAGGDAHAYPVDLADTDAVAALAARVLAEHGHIDVLVNNAGKSIRRSLAHSAGRMRDFRRTIDVNYLGPVQLVLALAPALRARGRGHIVNVSTVGVRVPPSPRWGGYQASKAAFDVWLRSITAELAADGVTVSTVYMGLVHTRMSAPTRTLRHLPGLSPAGAAERVFRAVVERPRQIAPAWLAPADLLGVAARGPVDRILRAAWKLSEAAPRAALGWRALTGLVRSRLLAPVRPDRAARMLAALRLGVGPATAAALAAACSPAGVAIVDERGEVSYAELERRSAALAGALAPWKPGDTLAIMCRNHRGFVEALLAASRLGADVLLCNTEFPGPQLAQALARHAVGAVILDEEFGSAFDQAGYTGPRVLAWTDGTTPAAAATIDTLVARACPAPRPPRRQGTIVVLTSGTTGAPKGAPRAPSLAAIAGPFATLLAELPLRAGEPMLVAPPLFHGFGLAYLGLALALRAPLVLRRRFDAASLVADVAAHRVATVVAVPAMLQRVLELPATAATPTLRALVSAGAPLSPALATRLTARFGEILFNLYGSSETGFAAIAAPADLRAAPGTVGRAPLGVRVQVLDAARAPAPTGTTGHIFVGSAMVMHDYAGGGSKERARGLMNTGDLGHLDADGRLFVAGREDDMIVSGGENVFPGEVEDLLARHEAVADVAVVGVDDAEFGQRLAAFVVARGELSVEEVKTFVKSHVARYKVPRDVIFVKELPRNPTGKLVRARLP